MFDLKKLLSKILNLLKIHTDTKADISYVNSAINSALEDIGQVYFEIVSSLPVTGDRSVIYLIEDPNDQNIYNEYVWDGTSYVNIGNTEIDLSGYIRTVDMIPITNSEIDSFFIIS